MSRDLAVVILNWNGHEDTIECCESIMNNDCVECIDIFILDNYSEETSKRFIDGWMQNNTSKFNGCIFSEQEFNQKAQFGKVNFIKGTYNRGFAAGNNFVLRNIMDQYQFFMLLNNDTTIDSDAITSLVKHMNTDKDIGIIGCRILNFYDRKSIWNVGGRFNWYDDRRYYSEKYIDKALNSGMKIIPSDLVSGCAMMIRQRILQVQGPLTERFFFGEEDFNYCKKMKLNNVRLAIALNSIIYHKVSVSINKNNKTGQRVPFNRIILYFTARIIDHKEFYSSKKWILWRMLYMSMLFIYFIRKYSSCSIAFSLIKIIKQHTDDLWEIDYCRFREIMDNEYNIR